MLPVTAVIASQLGVSPTFNLLTSIMDNMRPENKYLHLMNEQEAIAMVQKELNRKGNEMVIIIM